MSMYRQMWLAIILSTLLALLGSLLASTLNARNYLSEQLSSKNTDNATVLALALSQQNADTVMVELTVSALFDSGHYELIRVVDPLGKVIVERVAPAKTGAVPAWFVKALPLDATPGKAQISNGWNQLGTLTLVSDSRFAYLALWESAVQLVLALSLSGLVGGILGVMTLRRLHEPLQRVIKQATDISERRFVVIDVPDVPELRRLAVAMNSTVMRLKSMFAEEAQRLEVLRITANYDPLTGLANRTFFLVQLLDSLDREEAVGSTLLLVRASNLSKLNRQLDTSSVNALLKSFAETLNRHAIQTDGVAARIGEFDFALLVPARADARETADKLLTSLSVHSLAGQSLNVCIGMSRLKQGQDMAGLMAEASSALIAAETSSSNSIREATTKTAIEDDEKTVELLKSAVDKGRVRQLLVPVLDMQGKLVHHECSMELMLDGTEVWQPARHFLQIADKFHLLPQMNLSAIQLAFEKMRGDPELPGLAVSLLGDMASEKNFQAQLLELTGKNRDIANRLWLEVPEATVARNIEGFRELAISIRTAGSKVGLENFGRHFNQVSALHDFGLDFLKIDSSLVRGLQYSTDNQIFLKSLSAIAHKMGTLVFAEGVIDRAELVALESAGFDGASGPAVRDPG